MPKLSQLLGALPAVVALPDADADVSAPVSEDSRQIQPGGLFVARPSWVKGGADGHARPGGDSGE